VRDPAERPTQVRYLVLAIFCAAATIAYIQRNGLGVAVPLVMADLGVSKVEMGWVMSSFFVTYALVQIPAGWLASRWQTRRALTLFALLWSLATAAIAVAPTWQVLLAAQLAMGAAQAGLFPSVTLSLTHWWAATRRGVATGALASFMSVGSATGAALAGLLLQHVTWREMFVLYALPGAVWAIWFFLWFRDEPARHPAVNAAELDLIQRSRPDSSPDPHTRQLTPWRALLSSWALWCICGQHVFRAAGYIFYPTWFPTYLREARGSSVLASGLLTSLPLWAVVIGSPLGGMTSDWILNRTGSRRLGRQVFASVCMLLSALLILIGWQTSDATLAACVIAAGSFCAAFGGPCAYAITMDMGGRNVAAVFSTMNAVGSAGAFTFPFIVPWIVKASGWDVVLMMFAGIYVAAAVCWIAFDSRGTIGAQAAD
jgi:sugar phosphate permease